MHQVPPAELEALIKRHPNVIEAAVVGIPNERFGEIPKAFVILKEGTKTTDDDIKNFVKDKVSEYKQLRGKTIFFFDYNCHLFYIFITNDSVIMINNNDAINRTNKVHNLAIDNKKK